MSPAASIPVVVGVDVGGPKKGFHAVALRGTVLLAKFRSPEAAEVANWCEAQQAEAVAVDAPCHWRQPGGPARAAEIEMAGDGISSFSTPTQSIAERNAFYTWMLAGEALYQELQSRFPLYAGEKLFGPVSLETFPQAVACALAGKIVSAKKKGEVRREILRVAGVDSSQFTNIDEVDAALCALGAQSLLAGTHRAYGNAESGFLIVPRNAFP